MKNLTIFLLMTLLIAAPARAQDEPTPADIAKAKAAAVSAQGLVDLFAQTCIAYAGNMPRLKVWLDAHAKQANDPQSAYFLSGMQGKAWVKQNKSGNYAIVISDQMGVCNVKAEKGPVSAVVADLKADGAPKMKPTGDSPDGSFLGAHGRVLTYSLQSKGDDYIVVLVGSDKAAPIQSQLSLAAEGKDQ